MSEKVNKFLTTVGAMWGKRHESEEAAREWFKAWIVGLDRYEPWVLEAAAGREAYRSARRPVRTRGCPD